MEWISDPSRRSTVVRAQVSDIGLKDEETWDVIQNLMIDAMTRLEESLRPYIHKL